MQINFIIVALTCSRLNFQHYDIVRYYGAECKMIARWRIIKNARYKCVLHCAFFFHRWQHNNAPVDRLHVATAPDSSCNSRWITVACEHSWDEGRYCRHLDVNSFTSHGNGAYICTGIRSTSRKANLIFYSSFVIGLREFIFITFTWTASKELCVNKLEIS